MASLPRLAILAQHQRAWTIHPALAMAIPLLDRSPRYLRAVGVVLTVVPLTLKEANDFIRQHHRHHKPVVGHRFSLGARGVSGSMVAVAVVGRPVARQVDFTMVAEVTRVASDGTFNACSFLYGACARVVKEMGFRRIQTYILDSELGTTLRASGWRFDGMTPGGLWKHTDGKPRRTDQPSGPKQRWVKDFEQNH